MHTDRDILLGILGDSTAKLNASTIASTLRMRLNSVPDPVEEAGRLIETVCTRSHMSHEFRT